MPYQLILRQDFRRYVVTAYYFRYFPFRALMIILADYAVFRRAATV